MSIDAQPTAETPAPAADARCGSSALPHVDGVYRTTPRRIGLRARWFPSVAFYMKFAGIVWRGSALARRGRYGDREWCHSSLELLRALESVGVQFEISGLNVLEQLETPCVIAANHMSTLETGVLPVVIQPIRHVTFVVKQGLLEYPVFKHIMRTRNPIAVSQKNPRQDLKTTLEEGIERLRRGVSVVVFPQGARAAGFDLTRFNTIGVKLAERAGVPIVPTALVTDAWGLGQRIPELGRIDPAKRVHIAFGSPLWVDGRGADQHRATIEFIDERLRTWQTGARPTG